MQKTRILFVVLQLDAGGSERVVYDLVRSLDQNNFEIFIAAFKGGVLAEQLKGICKDIIFIEKKQGLDIFAMFRLAGIVKKYHIDVINAHHYMPCFYSFLAAMVLKSKKLIYTEHSVPEVESIANCFHGKILYWMLYRINAVIGVSRAITEKFQEKYPRHVDKIHEVLNGVNIDKFSGKEAREDVRSRWSLTDDQFVVGTVANFRKVKNHSCLVRAAGRLKDSHPQLRLFFVGTGFPGDTENSEHEVRGLVSELGLEERVIFAGYQENISDMLSALDAFCLPSFSEGLPVSLLEALAARVPVIGSEVSGINEVIKHKETGFLFPCNDDKALSIVFQELLDNPLSAKKYMSNGYAYIASHHNMKSFEQRYCQIFKENYNK